MARILINRVWYEQIEPSTFSESELEERILIHAPSIYPEYYVLPFKLRVESTLGNAQPDLVFISKDYSEWRVVEVEMGHHSFNGHVERQIEKLADAEYGSRVAHYLYGKNNELDLDKLLYLIENVPPQLLVIVNEPKSEWIEPLLRYNAIIAIFELFRAEDETEVFRVNGEYPTLFINTISECTFHPYAPRLIRIHAPAGLELPPRGKIKLRYNNCLTEWTRLDAEDAVFLSPVGNNPLKPGRNYELYRQSDNTLVLRPQIKV
jgi:hypothetical protein